MVAVIGFDSREGGFDGIVVRGIGQEEDHFALYKIYSTSTGTRYNTREEHTCFVFNNFPNLFQVVN